MKFEIVRFDPAFDWNQNYAYIPIFAVINRKMYMTGKWTELFQILLFTCCYKANNMERINSDVNRGQTGFRGKTLIAKDIEESRKTPKFAPNLYVQVYFPTHINCSALERIYYYIGEQNVEVYLLKYEKDGDPQEVYKQCASFAQEYRFKNTIKNVSTQYYIAHINGKVLSDREKFFRRIEKEYDNRILLGDISLDKEDEAHLKSYMFEALKRVAFENRNITHKKVFAFGLVYAALKNYVSKRFWPYLKDEYGIEIPSNYQNSVNEKFKEIITQTGKLYDGSVQNYVQNICMHAFVCNKCADQFFNYMFDFWRLDLSRSIENCYDGNGNDLFDILIDEISTSNSQDIMFHTTMALKMNPKGVKNRFRRILRMIDNSFWNDADYSKSKNRITILFNEWKNDPKSAFNKELKRTVYERKSGRGERLLSRPTIVYEPRDNSFRLQLPKQLLRGCTEEEHPVWYISIGEKQYTIEPLLMFGRAFLFTEECSIRFQPEQIFEQFDIQLRSERTTYNRRVIPQNDFRFFNSRNRCIEIDDDFISKDLSTILLKKNCTIQYLNGAFKDKNEFFDHYNVLSLDPSDGDILILPDDHALPIGRPLEEGIISSNRINGVYAIYEDNKFQISKDQERIFFKTSQQKLNGTSIKIFNGSSQDFFGKVIDKPLIQFKLDDSLDETFGYILDLNDYIKDDGLYRVELSIPGCMIRQYRICCISQFSYRYEGAPYIFKESGRIVFPGYLNIKTNSDWTLEKGNKVLEFVFDENSKDINEYVKDRKLHLYYGFQTAAVELVFDLPVLYWKYKPEDKWYIYPPEDTMIRSLPANIYIAGDINIRHSKMHVGHSEDYEESEIGINYDSENELYYFRTVDIRAFLSREKRYRFLYLKIDNVEIGFVKIYCRSYVRSKSLSGDFNNNVIYGYFDIYGNSDYMVTVKKDGRVIEEDVPLVDGRFKIDCPIEEGIYTINLYELEDDDSGFGSVSYPVDSYKLNLVDVRNFAGRRLWIQSIRDRNKRFAELELSINYYIKDLTLVDYAEIARDGDIYSWLYDSSDENEMSRFVYYSGTLCYEQKENKKMKEISKAIVIFDNNQNSSEVLINIIEDGEYSGLQYSPDRKALQPKMNGLSKYEKKRVHMIDDDYYMIVVQIGGKK